MVYLLTKLALKPQVECGKMSPVTCTGLYSTSDKGTTLTDTFSFPGDKVLLLILKITKILSRRRENQRQFYLSWLVQLGSLLSHMRGRNKDQDQQKLYRLLSEVMREELAEQQSNRNNRKELSESREQTLRIHFLPERRPRQVSRFYTFTYFHLVFFFNWNQTGLAEAQLSRQLQRQLAQLQLSRQLQALYKVSTFSTLVLWYIFLRISSGCRGQRESRDWTFQYVIFRTGHSWWHAIRKFW